MSTKWSQPESQSPTGDFCWEATESMPGVKVRRVSIPTGDFCWEAACCCRFVYGEKSQSPTGDFLLGRGSTLIHMLTGTCLNPPRGILRPLLRLRLSPMSARPEPFP